MSVPSCDSVDGIQKALGSMEEFTKLIHARRDLAKGHTKRLGDFIVLGRWRLDQFGQVGRIMTDTFDLKKEIPDIPDVLVADALWPIIRKYDLRTKPDVLSDEEIKHPDFDWSNNERPFPTSVSWGMPAHLPLVNDRCAVCGRGWGVQDAHDAYCDYDGNFYHTLCRELQVIEKTERKLKDCFALAGFEAVSMEPIKNGYWGKNDVMGAWYNVRTPYGNIRIGWRKRVIEIAFDELKMAPWHKKHSPDLNWMSLFEKEDVTKSNTHIHAWGYPKAADYLQRLRQLV
jgi:hypothetical protein